jgi:hypothetical protein
VIFEEEIYKECGDGDSDDSFELRFDDVEEHFLCGQTPSLEPLGLFAHLKATQGVRFR